MNKKCYSCSTVRSEDDFYKSVSNTRKCKPCCRAYAEQYKKEHILEHREADKRYRQKRRGERRTIDIEYKRKYSKENRDKVQAHMKVYWATHLGILERFPCEICGSTPSHGHHEDYSKPLEVRWLCALHHKLEHITS